MGKKRKLAVTDHETYEEDRAPAEYSNPHKQQAGGSRVEPETVSYLQEVSQHFSGLRDAEEKELLLANVLEEIQGKEGRIASDAVTSRLLEHLLVGAPAPQLMRFMQAFTNEDLMFSLAGSAFGSHVAEKVLAGLHHQADQLDDDLSQQLESLLAGMVGAIGGGLYDYIMDKHATHVARALLVVIAGHDVLSPVAKKKQQQQQQQHELADDVSDHQQAAATAAAFNAPAFRSKKSSLQEKLSGSSSSSDRHVRYPGLLRRYAKMLPCYDASNMSMLGKNSYSSPFIQAVLRAAAADSELLLLLLPPILGVDSSKAAAAPGQVLGSLTDSHVGRLLRDDCYSHLLEVVMTVMPQSLADEFYTRFLKGRLVPLTNHHSANFVIQAWLATMKDSTQVAPVLSELSPHLCDLLKRRRSGVIAALMAAAGRAGAAAQQQAAAAALAAALSQLPQWQGGEGTDHLAPALLTLDTNTTLGSSSSSNGQQQQQHWGSSAGGRLSTPGSAILATILTLYNKKAAKPFVTSVTSLNPVDAGRAARDSAGSRALQALIEGSAAGRDAKSQLLSRLSGSWCDIALQAAGSFFLEKAYAWASESEKEVIVSELASRSTLLMGGCPWGPMLARKLGLEAYQRSPDEWRKRAGAAATAAKAFEQMLSQDMPAQGSKRKRQQQQQNGDVAAAPAMTAAADGSSGKERKKRRREVAATVDGDQPHHAAAEAAAAAAVNGTTNKKKKRAKQHEDAAAAAAAAGDDDGNDAVLAAAAVDKPCKKKHKVERADTAAGFQEQTIATKQKKRKRHSSPLAPAIAAASGGGSSTDEYLRLLGFGGTGAAKTGVKSSKKLKTT